MSDSNEPMGPPSAAHSAGKVANPNAPHVPSKLSSSFTPASVEENNNKNNSVKSSSKPSPKGPDSKSGKPADGEKLSGAELKKRAKAEKAARRAKERQEREQAAGLQPGGGKPDDKDKKKADMAAQKKPGRMAVAPLPVPESKKKKEPVNEKVYAPFAHLSDHLRKGNMDTAGKDVHPRILTLGSQIANYQLLGSAVRCTAMLLAFKEVRLCFSPLRLVFKFRWIQGAN